MITLCRHDQRRWHRRSDAHAPGRAAAARFPNKNVEKQSFNQTRASMLLAGSVVFVGVREHVDARSIGSDALVARGPASE